ncbi:PH domain-containing protein [Bacillus sp. 1P06AnD]|uniref:PH domain-containing protein n=1 Tax=Bacillus sp. 1P06AnD TaxID=3132208 RepID=UPI0039A295A5
MTNVDKGSTIIWILEAIKSSIIPIIVASGAAYLFRETDFLLFAILLYLVYKIYDMLLEIILSPFKQKNTSYQVIEHFLYVRKGGLSKKEYTIPLKKIQHYDVEKTFFSRFFDLYSLSIYTAGDAHYIEYIKLSEVNKLKEPITKYVLSKEADIDE